VNEAAPDVERFLALAARLQKHVAGLTPVQAGLLAAAHMGIARDSRTFARLLDLAHALVLREMNALAERGGLLRIEKRDERTMRAHFALDKDTAGLVALLSPISGP
jgi:hypothetical protein